MILTDFQKEIINKIINGEITNISSFIKWKYNDKKIKIVRYSDYILDNYNNKYILSFRFQSDDVFDDTSNFFKEDGSNFIEQYLYFIDKDQFDFIGQFISLWKSLEKGGYIISTRLPFDDSSIFYYMKREKAVDLKHTIKTIVKVTKELVCLEQDYNNQIKNKYSNLSQVEIDKVKNELIKTNHENLTYDEIKKLNSTGYKAKYKNKVYYLSFNEDLSEYIGSYKTKEIIVLPDLKELRKNKYQSASELRFSKERKERILAQIVTIMVAVISLILNCYFTLSSSDSQKEIYKTIGKLYQSQERLNNYFLKR